MPKEAFKTEGDFYIDGTKNQTYLKDGKPRIDDPEDPPPTDEPELWRHIAAVRDNVLYDAYHPKGVSLKRLAISGDQGYFHTMRKVYRVVRRKTSHRNR
jgi:hypothetical protein